MPEQTADWTILDPISTEQDTSPESRESVASFMESMSKDDRPSEVAEILAQMGFVRSALKFLQAEVNTTANDRERARCYFVAGRIRERQGLFAAAARCYRAVAVELLEGDERYFAPNNLGYCLNRIGRHAEAEAACRQAIDTDPAPFNAHKNLGIALERSGRLIEAAEAYLVAARSTEVDDRPLRHLRVLLANHPEVERERPAITTEVDSLLRSSRQKLGIEPRHESALRPESVRSLLKGIRVCETIRSGELQVFGLRWERVKPIDYLTLDRALAQKRITIGEVGEAGTVPRLEVKNRSNRAVFLMAGEQLIGARQNRVINASTMVAANSGFAMPVSCVEQGRWTYRSRSFQTAGTSSHHLLRAMMAKHVHASYKVSGRPDSDQGAVWREVARKLRAFQHQSPSSALHDAYESSEERLKRFHDDLTPGESWSGALFCFGNSIAGVDLFDKPETLHLLWPKVVRAYAFDALEGKQSGTIERAAVEEWVQGLSRTAVDSYPSAGLGTDVRLEGDRQVGAMLLVDDVPVHLEAFADEID